MTHEYIGTKIVTAWPQEKDGKPGYGVKYSDGYTSWSPKEQFEESYLDIGHVSGKPAFLQRLIGEKAQLDSNCTKLRNFIDGDKFDVLDFEQRDLLREQLDLMRNLSDCLDKRIMLIEKNAA
jgi:hypothetical protein